MTIEIEAKLDVIEDKIDQIAYEKVAPRRSYEISDEGKMVSELKQKPGFLDSIIKGMTSKGILGGIAAGGTAGGVLVLADVIKNLTKQSKILGEIQSSLQKSVSLLVDLVLLPFLPLIVGAIVLFYQGILLFGAWWADVWKTIKEKGLSGLLSLGVKMILTDLKDIENNIVDFFFGTGEKKKSAALNLLARLEVSPIGILAGIAMAILNLWFGEDRTKELGTKPLNFILGIGFMDIPGVIIAKEIAIAIMSWWFGESNEDTTKRLDFSLNVFKGALSTIGSWIWSFLDWLFTASLEQKIIDLQVRVAFTIGSGGDIWELLTGQTPSINSAGGGADWSGRSTQKTGGADRTFSAGNTYVFNGLTMPELESKIYEINRQGEARYS